MNEHTIPWWRTDLGKHEIAAIENAVFNHCITQGPITEDLEKCLGEFLGVPYVLLTTSGSIALLMALMACDVKPGDEVIVPACTFMATFQAPLLLGAKVKLVDVEPSDSVMTAEGIKKAITSRTKVIIPVHLNGRCSDVGNIKKLAAHWGLKVVEDSAQALYSRNTVGYLGTQSDIGVFSTGITKLITTVRGGFVITKKRKIFENLKKIRNSGILRRGFFVLKGDIAGFNFKFNDILASVGISQFKNIEKKIIAHKKIYAFYKKELENLTYLRLLEVDVDNGEFPLWVEAISSRRDKIIALLKEKKIQAKPFDPCVCDFLRPGNVKNFKNARRYAGNGLILPCGPDQSLDDLRCTVRALKEIEKKAKVKGS